MNRPKRGELYWVDTAKQAGSELNDRHAWVVLQENKARHPNQLLVIMAPLVKWKDYHEETGASMYFERIDEDPSTNNLDQPRCIDLFQTRSIAWASIERKLELKLNAQHQPASITPAQLDFAANALALIVGVD